MAQAAASESRKLHFTGAFSSFSTDDIAAAKRFYGETLDLDVEQTREGLRLDVNGQTVFIYPKADHRPADFTVLNLMVDDIREAVAHLKSLGIEFESYEGSTATDDDNIFWGSRNNNGPNIAWFKDPAGNFVSVIEN